jgi:RNA polymerase sigma-70 factor, ECF subfamily
MRRYTLDPDRVVEHLPRLYRIARAWCRSREEAEDLVQETYARVLVRPRLLRGQDEFGYMLRAMRNTVVSQRRAQSRRPQQTPLVDEASIAGRPGDDPAEAVQNRRVYDAIRELPDDFRDALVAVDVAGLSYGEAARLLDQGQSQGESKRSVRPGENPTRAVERARGQGGRFLDRVDWGRAHAAIVAVAPSARIGRGGEIDGHPRGGCPVVRSPARGCPKMARRADDAAAADSYGCGHGSGDRGPGRLEAIREDACARGAVLLGV